MLSENSEDWVQDHDFRDFSFFQKVVLDVILPNGDRELVQDYRLRFVDKNCILPTGGINFGYMTSGEDDLRCIPTRIEEATSDYVASLEPLVQWLEDQGYLIRNTLLSYFSP